MPQQPVRILHLSDFHFSEKTEWDSRPLLKALPTAVKNLVDEGLAPDLVAITGDMAQSGKTKEYGKVGEWIDEHLLGALPAGFSKTQILLVPGNHDVNQKAVKGAARALQAVLLEEESQSRIAEALVDDDDRRALLNRHSAYLKFASDYGMSEGKLKVPWWSASPKINGCRVFLAGLCTSWMSCDEQGQGKLLLSRWQVNKVFEDVPEDADFRIVLMHHPWSYIAEFDAKELEETIRRKADLVLRGHLHAQRTATVNDPDDSWLELTAGSVYKGSKHPNAFQLIELFPADRRVRVHYRTWHKDEWIPDRMAYKSAPEGIADFSLAGGTGPPDPDKYLESLRRQTPDILT